MRPKKFIFLIFLLTGTAAFFVSAVVYSYTDTSSQSGINITVDVNTQNIPIINCPTGLVNGICITATVDVKTYHPNCIDGSGNSLPAGTICTDPFCCSDGQGACVFKCDGASMCKSSPQDEVVVKQDTACKECKEVKEGVFNNPPAWEEYINFVSQKGIEPNKNFTLIGQNTCIAEGMSWFADVCGEVPGVSDPHIVAVWDDPQFGSAWRSFNTCIKWARQSGLVFDDSCSCSLGDHGCFRDTKGGDCFDSVAVPGSGGDCPVDPDHFGSPEIDALREWWNDCSNIFPPAVPPAKCPGLETAAQRCFLLPAGELCPSTACSPPKLCNGFWMPAINTNYCCSGICYDQSTSHTCGNNTLEDGETCDFPSPSCESGFTCTPAGQSGECMCVPSAFTTLAVDLKGAVDGINWSDPLETKSLSLSGVDLKATVSGTETGTINYKFNCGIGKQNVGNWNFNEGSGTTAFDSSGYGNNGTLYNGPAWVDGKYGKALQFDGTNDYVNAADSNSLKLGTNQTIAIWIKPTANIADWARIVGKGNSTYRNYGLWRQQDGDILYQIYSAGGNGDCWNDGGSGNPLNVPVGVWAHIIGTYDGANMRVYRDGVLIKTCPYTKIPYTSSDPLTIGYAGFHTYFNGIIDEVKIYGQALTDINEILNLRDNKIWDYEFNNISDNPKITIDSCDYPSPGTYFPNVFIERGTKSAADTLTVKVGATTLMADLKAATDNTNWQDPLPPTGAIGSPLDDLVDLKATVSGTATGTVNYKFDCDTSIATGNGDCMADGNYSDCDKQADSQVATTYIAENLCDYASAGTYTAKTLVQRDTATPATDTVIINVIANHRPTTSNLQVEELNGCCANKVPIEFTWTYSDQDSEDQSAYQIIVAKDSGFSDIALDTGKFINSSKIYSNNTDLNYHDTYYWKIKVWDSHDPSAESDPPSVSSFTVGEKWPCPDFTWDPLIPKKNQNVNFDSQASECFASPCVYSWTFQGGNPSSSVKENPDKIKFPDPKADNKATLSLTDNESHVCSVTKTIFIEGIIPKWIEIQPF